MGLEHELATIKAAPNEGLPQHLEETVWQGIKLAREARAQGPYIFAIRAVAVLCATAVGIVGGSLGSGDSRAHHEISVFSVDSHLAPSTLLDGRG